jgi:DNA-directed RNA polymerase subunit RPC12/RpoP
VRGGGTGHNELELCEKRENKSKKCSSEIIFKFRGPSCKFVNL